ncbi:hypothetical protein MUB18_08420 [Sphingobacterium sp. PCS056]|uniref:hypothetical protein n=1 Tax=Sphingobacterium sp. PCS056 TaxID=2931400 RepID=UPI00200E31C5|nr:hypothetical protein [Sphingobacterium sp. PCS056]UPZ38318.1 hypothetical protein MUB18_08420 [Sphingobacterium sp. PCS056]
MKLKIFVFFIIIALFSNCNKESVQISPDNEIEKISSKLMNSEIFSSSLDSIINNTMTILQEINSAGGKKLVKEYLTLSSKNPSYNQLSKFYSNNNLDTEKLLFLNAKNLANVLVIIENHPELSSKDGETQSNVFYNIAENLKSTSYISNTKIRKYANKKLNPFKNKIQSSLSASNNEPTTPDDPKVPESSLSWQQVGSCALTSVGGAIAGSTKLFKQLHGVITGYNLGYSAIVNVATSAFRTFAGSNAAGMAITFGVCIAAEIIFGDEEMPVPALDTTEWAIPDEPLVELIEN